jgi:hypothetical protein
MAERSVLYARRWNVELELRNLKTTTGMDVFSCQTDDREIVVAPTAGLQHERIAYCSGRLHCGGDAQLELQSHNAAVDGVGSTRSVGYGGTVGDCSF